MEIIKPQKIRAQNLAFLTNLIQEHGPLSQRELAEISGLSVVTISKIMPELLIREIIKEESVSVVTGGRRAVSYQFNAAQRLLLVGQLIEQAGEFIFNFYICDLEGKALFQEEKKGSSLSWIGLKEYFKELIRNYPKISGIILGIPGVELDGSLKMLDYPPLLYVNVRSELLQEFQLPVAIENDINLAALGYTEAQGNQEDAVIGIYYPKDFPPGAGIVLNGKILKGRNGFAGEIQYLPLGAKWESQPLEKVDLVVNLSEVVQSLISLYDPREILVYTRDNRITEIDLASVQQKMAELFPLLVLPKLSLSNDFADNYFKGLVSQGLKLITN